MQARNMFDFALHCGPSVVQLFCSCVPGIALVVIATTLYCLLHAEYPHYVIVISSSSLPSALAILGD